MLHTWLAKTDRFWDLVLRRRTFTHPAPKPRRIAVEQLEDRVVPAGRPLPYPVIYTGAETGAPPAVRAYNAESAALKFERSVFEEGFTGGVRVAAADLTGDGYPDLVAAPGKGGGPRVRVLDGKTGEQVPGPIGNFFAYDPSFVGGVEVAAADVDGDGTPDVVTAAGPGGGPHVKVFSGTDGSLLHNFFAFGPDFLNGIHIAAADFTLDGRAEVVVGAGEGGGPHVRVYDLATGGLIPGPLGNFFAYDPTSRGGVHVGTDALAGDVTGDEVADLVVGPGRGAAPEVKVYSGADGSLAAAFAAFAPDMTAGVRVAAAYVTDDAFADVVVATPHGVENKVRVFDGASGKLIDGPAAEFSPFGPGDTRGVYVAASNDPPLGAPDAVDDEASTDEDTPVNFYYLTYNDTDPELDTVTVTGVTQGAHGAVSLLGDGTATYTPAANWSGTDTFTYTATDGTNTDTATVTVTVLPVNDRPLASSLGFSASTEDHPRTLSLSGTDAEGDPLEYLIDQPPAHGTLGAVDGKLVIYYPDGNYAGPDSFTYRVSDGRQLSDPAEVSVSLMNVVDPAGVKVTHTAGSTDVGEPSLFWDEEEDGGDDFTVVLNTQPTADVTITLAPSAQVAVDKTTLTFTAANWSTHQTVRATAVGDSVDEADTHTGSVTFSVSSADPVYNGVSVPGVTVAVTDMDTAGVFIDPVGEPIDLDEATQTGQDYTVELTSKPSANVTLTLTPPSTLSASQASLTFTPTDWNVPQTVTVTAANDATAQGYRLEAVAVSAASADALYQGLVSDVSAFVVDDDAPNAYRDEVGADEDTAATVYALDNDLDPEWDPLSVVSYTQPDFGTVALNGDDTFTYTPPAGWSGAAWFTYRASDGSGPSNEARVSVGVRSKNDDPVVTNPGSKTSAEDAAVSLQIAASDPDDEDFIYTAEDLPPGLTIDARTGRIWGWVGPQASGTYSTVVTATDLKGGSGTTSFTWAVTDTNHRPYINRTDAAVSYAGDSVSIIDEPAAVDIDSGGLTFSVTGLPPGVTYNQGTISGQIPSGSEGTYEVTATVTDASGATDTKTFDWVVLAPAATAPIAKVHFGSFLTHPMIPVPTFARPATPLQGTVGLSYPTDPNAAFTVTLEATPAGRVSLSATSFTLSHGQTAAFTATPLAVSQRPGDIVIRAKVSGHTTGVADMTSVGVVMPDRVRGPNTPTGMVDRVSVGAGNWGSFTGVAHVAPALLGVGQVGFGVHRPAADDKYGNAIVPSGDAARAGMIGRSILSVIGTVETAPSMDANGLPDGLARNANNLQLQATIAHPTGLLIARQSKLLSVAPIAATVSATDLTPIHRQKHPTQNRWSWGVEFKMEVTVDGGKLDNIMYFERLVQTKATKLLAGAGQSIQTTWAPAAVPQPDFIGVTIAAPQFKFAQNRAEQFATNNERSEYDQWMVYYNKAITQSPRVDKAPVIVNSGFLLIDQFQVNNPEPGPWMYVSRDVKDIPGAGVKKGMQKGNAAQTLITGVSI